MKSWNSNHVLSSFTQLSNLLNVTIEVLIHASIVAHLMSENVFQDNPFVISTATLGATRSEKGGSRGKVLMESRGDVCPTSAPTEK